MPTTDSTGTLRQEMKQYIKLKIHNCLVFNFKKLQNF